MPQLTEQELNSKIKTNFCDKYLIYGEETYLTKAYIDKLIKASVDDSFVDFNLRVYEPDEPDLSDIYESCLAVPMMAETKCVVVKEYPIEDADENDIKALETMLVENPEDNTLVFAYPTVQPKGNLANVKAMVKLFEKYGCVVKFTQKTRQDLVKLLENSAKKRNKIFEGGVADYLVGTVGMDLNLLLNELDKVCAYADGNIKRSDVDAVCIKSLEAKVFVMTDDLLAGRFDAAFHGLSKLFENHEEPMQIMGAIISQYANIYRVKAAVKSGGSPDALAGYYGYKAGDFKLKKAAQAASKLTFEQIKESLEILGEADAQMKSTSIGNKQILEQMLVKLTRAGKRK